MTETITLSLNELRALLFRYFEATFAHAYDFYDAARLVVWLEARGLGGIEALLSALSSQKNETNLEAGMFRDQSDRLFFDLKNMNAICAGLAIADLCVSNVKTSGVSVARYINSDVAPMPIALVADCAARGFWVAALYRMPGGDLAHLALMTPDASDPDIFAIIEESEAYVPAVGEALLICAETEKALRSAVDQEFGASNKGESARRIIKTAAEFGGVYQNVVANGITITRKQYQQMCDVADAILVEASDASRRGAGD